MRVGTREMLITVHLESTKPCTENELTHRGAKLKHLKQISGRSDILYECMCFQREGSEAPESSTPKQDYRLCHATK
jgi:hypothetical protein